MLSVESYDAAESSAMDCFPNTAIQAFRPEIFGAAGYPTRVANIRQLWRYIDVMHERRIQRTVTDLLGGLTEREFDLFKRITRIVDEMATEEFSVRGHATSALLRAIHAMRLIKITTQDTPVTVLEVGPGCGYLGALLILEGYPYIATDITQAFYLYQNFLFRRLTKTLTELVTSPEDVVSVQAPAPGSAVHIPWWKWLTLAPEKIELYAGILTSNHALCEMHPYSCGYLANVAGRILGNFPGGGSLVFEGWGDVMLHSQGSVAAKFKKRGFRLVQNDAFSTAFVLQESNSGAPIADGVGQHLVKQRSFRALGERMPGVKGLVKTLLEPGRYIGIVHSGHELSARLRHGLSAVKRQTSIGEPEIWQFLKNHFDGNIPEIGDPVFLDIAN